MKSADRKAADLDCGGRNPMLAISVDIVVANSASIVSVQARKRIRSVAPPLPKKSIDFSGFPENSLCRFLRMLFFCVCPGISPQRRFARSLSGGRGRVISHSDGHSVFNLPLNNQLGTFLPFARKNFCKLFVNGSYNDKKSRYTAHQISGRKSLAISLMKLCTGSEIQKPSMSAFFRSAGRHCTGAAQPQSLLAAALSFIQIFNCGPYYESKV